MPQNVPNLSFLARLGATSLFLIGSDVSKRQIFIKFEVQQVVFALKGGLMGMWTYVRRGKCVKWMKERA